MRRLLDFLYDAAAWLAALAMVGVLLMVLTSILGRLLDFHLPGTDAYAGYSMAAAGFLSLAHTLKKNEHIRVTLLMGRLPALHGALDLGRLEQRGVVMHLDLQLATGGGVHVLGELHQVFGVEVAGRVGRGQVPFGLGSR